MTSKFREALDVFKLTKAPTMTIEEYSETIRQALRIAERLESGEVSSKMMAVGYNYIDEYGIFTAMAKVMIEEVEDDKRK